MRVLAGRPSGTVTIPWNLLRTDAQAGRIYLSADVPSCDVFVGTLVEARPGNELVIQVVAKRHDPPCSAEQVTLFGYVESPIDLTNAAVSGQAG